MIKYLTFGALALLTTLTASAGEVDYDSSPPKIKSPKVYRKSIKKRFMESFKESDVQDNAAELRHKKIQLRKLHKQDVKIK